MKDKNPLLVPQTRNAWGLIEGVDYIFNPDGSVNWRSMVKSEFLFPNKSWFENRKQQMPQTIEGLSDAQLLIKLGGIKELAKLRGYKSVQYNVVRCETTYVAVKCGITWIPNYESDYESYYEDIANATISNTSDFAVKFLETIAANRAFIRAVRNFLNVHIVGSDEIDSSKKGTPSIPEEEQETVLPSAQNMLQKAAKSAGHITFAKFKGYINDAKTLGLYSNNECTTWNDWQDIPAKDARLLISLLKNS
jgi:hypothetical protein